MLNSHFLAREPPVSAPPSSGKSDVPTGGWPGLPPPHLLLVTWVTVWARWGISAATSPPLPTVSKPCPISLPPGQGCGPSVALLWPA